MADNKDNPEMGYYERLYLECAAVRWRMIMEERDEHLAERNKLYAELEALREQLEVRTNQLKSQIASAGSTQQERDHIQAKYVALVKAARAVHGPILHTHDAAYQALSNLYNLIKDEP